MKSRVFIASLVAPFALASVAQAADGGRAACEKLATSVTLPNTALKASYVTTKDELKAAAMPADEKAPAGAELPVAVMKVFDNNGPTGANLATLPMCRVEVVITPAPGAEIKAEVWLPESSKWNGRFLSAGIGGAAGYIDRVQLTAGAAQGYATSTTDAGSHTANSLEFTFGRNPEWRTNYTGRGVHLTAVTGKALVQAYYNTKPKASLFYGCSGGGYEGLGEVQNFPTDYDGVLAGDPPVNWLAQVVWQGRSYMISHKEPGGTIPIAKLITFNKAVVKQCDMLDGVADGVIEQPRKCKVDFTQIQCKGADSNECLTVPQVKTLTALYADWIDPKTGALIYPGFMAGAETAPAARTRLSGFNGNSVMSPAKPGPMLWHLPETFKEEEWMAYDFEKGLADENARFAPYAHAKSDMSAFKKAGGKLIIYSGWADPNLNSQNLVNYYETVKKTMGADADAFSRLFMVPGMNHCSGGPGTNMIGQTADQSLGERHDAGNNILLALDKWVTQGIAPEQVVGTKFVDDQKEKGVVRTHAICAYPKFAKWDGKGNAIDAKSFTCVNP